MTVDLTPQARAAADWLEDHEWVQGTWGDDTKACLHGAVRTCTPQTGDGYLVSAVLTAKGYSTGWNDEKDRTEVEVLDVLRNIEVTDAELEDTFGPNWRLVVSLVRQAATLTPVQATQLTAAWDAAGDAARAAAGDAAWAAVTRDLITPEHYQLLVGPWQSVMGELVEA